LTTAGAAHAFTLKTRVYYEDTDAAGVVYYANYLKFFERCRSEWLRSIGHDQHDLAAEHRLAFVVRSVTIDYRQPARLDDLLDVDLQVEKIGAAHVIFRQTTRRHGSAGDGELVTAQVQIVCVNLTTMKSTKIPAWLRAKLESLQ
jgi:acyl-CoA thioester hydrolase